MLLQVAVGLWREKSRAHFLLLRVRTPLRQSSPCWVLLFYLTFGWWIGGVPRPHRSCPSWFSLVLPGLVSLIRCPTQLSPHPRVVRSGLSRLLSQVLTSAFVPQRVAPPSHSPQYVESPSSIELLIKDIEWVSKRYYQLFKQQNKKYKWAYRTDQHTSQIHRHLHELLLQLLHNQLHYLSRPYLIFSLIVAAKVVGSWLTIAICNCNPPRL